MRTWKLQKGKKARLLPKARSQRKPRNRNLQLFLHLPTPQEIELFLKREKKEKTSRPVESAAAKAQRLALAPLAAYRTAKFDLDVTLIQRPYGVICSRNLYPGHVKELEEQISSRGENFPHKTIYLALGNVSLYVF